MQVKIGALQKLTLLDYPGHLACTVFLPGCNLRCPYCHNPGLVLPDQMVPAGLSVQELLDFLDRRKGKLEGVCITGGEPTLHPELPELIGEIRSRGFLVKLDTNGSRPEVLAGLLDRLDYVAMDIKNAPERYRETCGGADILARAEESVRLILDHGADYEFRTTVFHPYHDPAAIAAIGRWIHGAKRYFLQNFVDSGNLVGCGCSALTEPELQALLAAARTEIPGTQLRGI